MLHVFYIFCTIFKIILVWVGNFICKVTVIELDNPSVVIIPCPAASPISASAFPSVRAPSVVPRSRCPTDYIGNLRGRNPLKFSNCTYFPFGLNPIFSRPLFKSVDLCAPASGYKSTENTRKWLGSILIYWSKRSGANQIVTKLDVARRRRV